MCVCVCECVCVCVCVGEREREREWQVSKGAWLTHLWSIKQSTPQYINTELPSVLCQFTSSPHSCYSLFSFCTVWSPVVFEPFWLYSYKSSGFPEQHGSTSSSFSLVLLIISNWSRVSVNQPPPSFSFSLSPSRSRFPPSLLYFYFPPPLLHFCSFFFFGLRWHFSPVTS